MTSQVTSGRRQAAARANGRAAKGRKSVAGKASSARNALRHGLSVPLAADPAASLEIAALARAIAPPPGTGAGGEAAPELAELARGIAQAQLDLVRVRRVRHDLIADALGRRDDDLPGSAASQARILEIVTEFAKRQGALAASLLGHIAASVRKGPGPDQLARTLGDLAPRLAAMDRYERRARSRRKHAIQAYDERKLQLLVLQPEVNFGRTKLNSNSHLRGGGA